MIKKAFGPILAILAMLAVPSAASATTISFSLNHGGGDIAPSNGPFGTVELTQTVSDQVIVKVILLAGNGFVDTGSGKHPDFAFSLNPAIAALDDADIVLLDDGVDPDPNPPDQPWKWVFGGAVTTSDNLGEFQYQFNCSGSLPDPNPTNLQRCGNGGSNPNPGPLEFRITKTGLNLSSFVGSDGGTTSHLFVADIIDDQPGGTGKTGLVWADGVTIDDRCVGVCTSAETPEPASMVLLGTGLIGLASAARRRRSAK